MQPETAFKILLVVDLRWCLKRDTHKLKTKHWIPLSDRGSRFLIFPINDITVRFRNHKGHICIDHDARLLLTEKSGNVFLASPQLAADLQLRGAEEKLIYFSFEYADTVMRVTAHLSPRSRLAALADKRPELRLGSFDLPPISVTELEPSLLRDGMDSDGIYEVLLNTIQNEDPELFAIQTETFLKAPHIIVPLLSHLASLSAEDNLKFPVQLRRLSDQFRLFLEAPNSSIRIHKIQRNHLDTWASAQNKRFAFVDGGIAKIAGLPGTEPTALRVGVYCVRAGDTSPDREKWFLRPYVVGDLIDKNTGVPMEDDEQTDLRRLGEAARYTLEPLTALRFVNEYSDIDQVFLHGPLINQFVMYDEGHPHFIPFLHEHFLESVGITRSAVEEAVKEIPPSRDRKSRMWRQFMAIYAYVSLQIMAASRPFVGVVERSAGRWLAQAVINSAVEAKLVTKGYVNKVLTLLNQYNISDDFLFGCVLAEGEYITPTRITKNEERRARPDWQPVVRQFPKPFATVLKTTEFSFPFRVEMNDAAKRREVEVMNILYHTARLLPRYAFPVGLDIVDKYAKVPDWLSRNISARMAANVLSRTIAEGDVRVVTQVRQLLARNPRDFFFRPSA